MAKRCFRMGVNVLEKDFLYYASLGHKTSSVEPSLFSKLLGFRKGTSVLSLENIKESLSITKHFVNVLFEMGSDSAILFIDLEEGSNVSTKFCALKALEPHFTENWSSGTLTNAVLDYKVDAIFILSAKESSFIIQEANKLNIPVIGVVDSDTTANLLTYPILANDNSIELRHQLTVDISLTILEAKLIRYGLSCA